MADGQLSEPIRQALARLALDTPLRRGIERRIRDKGGAIYVLGCDESVEERCRGGYPQIDCAVTADNVNQQSKMDLAIIISTAGDYILRSSVTLAPKAPLITQGAGARHLAAANTAREIDYPVVALSEESGTVTLYVGDDKLVLNPHAVLLSKAAIGVLALDTCVRKLSSGELGQRATATLTERARATVLRLDTLLLQFGGEGTDIEQLVSDYCGQLGMDRLPSNPRHLPSEVKLMHAVARELDEWQERALDAAQQTLSDRPVPMKDTTNRAFPRMSFDNEHAALRWYDQTWSTLVTAIEEAAEAGDPATALRRSMAMLEFFYRGKSRKSWIEVTSLAVIAARQVDDRQAEASLLTSTGVAQRELGNLDVASELFEAALVIWRELGDGVGEAETLNHLAFALDEMGSVERALRICADALALVRGEAEPRVEGKILNNLAGICCRAGRHEQAMTHADEAIDLFTKDRYDRGRAWALSVKGNIHHRSGRHSDAQLCYRSALSAQAVAGDDYGAAVSRAGLGDVLLALGDPGGARGEWTAAFDYFTAISDTRALDIRAKLDELDRR